MKETMKTAKDHVQTPASRSGLPPSGTGVANSHTATPANAQPDNLQYRSGDSDESKVGNSQEKANTCERPNRTQHQSNDSTISAVGSPHKAILGVAEHGSLPAEDAARGLPTSIELDKELPLDDTMRRDLWKEAHEKLSQDKQLLLPKIEKVEGSKVVQQVVRQIEQKYPEHVKRLSSLPLDLFLISKR